MRGYARDRANCHALKCVYLGQATRGHTFIQESRPSALYKPHRRSAVFLFLSFISQPLSAHWTGSIMFSLLLLALPAVLALPSRSSLAHQLFARQDASCPTNVQPSCSSGRNVDTCCVNAPGGYLLQTQFWDASPATGPSDSFTIHGFVFLTSMTLDPWFLTDDVLGSQQIMIRSLWGRIQG